MRCRWWNLLLVVCFCFPIATISSGCGDAHMSQDEADALATEETENEGDEEELTDAGDDGEDEGGDEQE